MIISNSALCLDCDVEIKSRHRHDYVTCPCGGIAVDGGRDYLKRSCKTDARWKDTSIVTEEKDESRD